MHPETNSLRVTQKNNCLVKKNNMCKSWQLMRMCGLTMGKEKTQI